MFDVFKKILFSITLLLGGVVPLMAHPIVYLPEWFGSAILVIGVMIYFLVLWVSWSTPFLRYIILLVTFIPVAWEIYINSGFYNEMMYGKRQKEEKKQVLVHYSIDSFSLVAI